jgi:hypothetical protein
MWLQNSRFAHSCSGARLFSVAVLALLSVRTSNAKAQSLISGNVELTITAADKPNAGMSIRLHDTSKGNAAGNEQPAEILIKDQGMPRAYSSGYSTVRREGASMVATAQIATAHGSEFQIRDVYTESGATGGFKLDRTVKVVKANAADQGFNSRFSLGFAQLPPAGGAQFFSPSVWYNQNEFAGPHSIGDEPPSAFLYYREMRTGLPFVSMRDPESGLTAALGHLDEKISSGVDERSSDWLVDGSIQYASLGIERLPAPEIGVIFPGITGELSDSAQAQPRFYRSHPVTEGFEQHYAVLIKVDSFSNYRAQLASDWRYFYKLSNPQPAAVPLETIYQAEINLLDHYAQVHSGVMGWPFVVDIPDGKIKEARNGHGLAISYQMGYVGQQLPDAYQLIRFGLLHKEDAPLAKGKAIVDFWASKSLLPSGLPQTWYNVDPPTFRNTSLIYMRPATDGMEGALAAAMIMRQHGNPQPEWEKFCSRFGDWLVSHQNADGSFYRAYSADSTVAQDSKLNSADPIRFLVQLYAASGDKRYLQAAVRAGNFSLQNITEPGLYVGGTVDRPEPVQDKEACVEALHGFLSLYDATHEAKWLDGAVAAAEYTETWNLSWEYPIQTQEPAFKRAGTRGQSFIKIIASSVDTFLSFEACDYYRLSLYTGDDHFKAFARILLSDTKLTTDWDGSLGYAQPGLVREASNVEDFKTEPNVGWLPWLSDAELSSMSQLDDLFGSLSIDAIEKMPIAVRRRDNENVLGKPGSSGWSVAH